LLAVASLLRASGPLDGNAGVAAAERRGAVAAETAPALNPLDRSLRAGLQMTTVAAAPSTALRLTSAPPRRDPNALLDFERCYGPTVLLLRPPTPLCLHPPPARLSTGT
ncbi:MAG TPA: hypothetical protein VFU81_12860, partial [Thermomicrobiales bacterium]|nr:hypothetical protein [Thermomicrobiales bacterium]